ncbi:uncharacterized protein BP5553_07575 [Venustampulla echinocandica]|uniref:laccase n=1 Tax=Venustampulla echinocandica TaxID=2656787 RepID=A0A370TGX2_9HELO|nr:uncharacterized protein BP5553_07575 [Venustampulla echinocandica]RDL34447.1 hypothetical protein BP5553_07575 [Venustampulla echinocandica]
MWGLKFLAFSLALGLVRTSALPEARLKPVQIRQSSQSCNTPANRQCWLTNGFSVDTDSEVSYPETGGPPIEYFLDIKEKQLAPDGRTKNMLVINGTYPGPTITADWGDRLIIHVTNSMTDNGTSIHWHGISQVGSNTEDGANGVTECPIPPGQTRTYSFIATQHGTAWYHSHYSGQYGDGVLGSIVINGPATQNYEEDLGPLTITDYYTKSMWQMGEDSMHGGPPQAHGALINGVMKNSENEDGSYASYTVKPNTTYRLRIINTGIDNGFKVSLDGHPFTVIQADFVPLKPYNTTWLFVAIGQRYDVVFTTNQAPANYWFRAEVPSGCGSNLMNKKIFAIFSYSTVTAADPTSTASDSSAVTCADPTGLEPRIPKSVPDFTYVNDNTDKLNVGFTGSPVNTWKINDNSISVDWKQPTLRYLADGQAASLSEIPGLNLYELSVPDKFYYWVIQNGLNIPHPIHLHGHEFYILGQTNGTTGQTFSGDKSKLNFEKPPRRDVATLPGNGWMVIAFQANNPGVWLMHCHIAWHVSQGFGVQFLERVSEIPAESLAKVSENCKAWDEWYGTTTYKQPDSGLRRA